MVAISRILPLLVFFMVFMSLLAVCCEKCHFLLIFIVFFFLEYALNFSCLCRNFQMSAEKKSKSCSLRAKAHSFLSPA